MALSCSMRGLMGMGGAPDSGDQGLIQQPRTIFEATLGDIKTERLFFDTLINTLYWDTTLMGGFATSGKLALFRSRLIGRPFSI
jgi:hypothetical protein